MERGAAVTVADAPEPEALRPAEALESTARPGYTSLTQQEEQSWFGAELEKAREAHYAAAAKEDAAALETDQRKA